MGETKIHKLVKEKIAEALREEGYEAETEVLTEKGRLDVYATKEGEEPIKVEVQHTHIPNWVLVEVKGNLPKEPVKDVPAYWREESPYHEAYRKKIEKADIKTLREELNKLTVKAFGAN